MATVDAQSPLLASHPRRTASSPQTATNDSQSPTAATGMANNNILPPTSPTYQPPALPRKADTTMSWGTPAGLAIRSDNDENLVIFRKAIGINYINTGHDSNGNSSSNGNGWATLEEGRKTATGIYRTVLRAQARKAMGHALLQTFIYAVYFAQILIGAALTALGATASRHEWLITVLGAFNTVLAGVLALIKGSGQPQKLGKDRVGYRRLRNWIEETEALLAVGVIGRNRREVGLLVESAFKRYEAARASEEDNDPDFYIYRLQEPLGHRMADDDDRSERSVHRGQR